MINVEVFSSLELLIFVLFCVNFIDTYKLYIVIFLCMYISIHNFSTHLPFPDTHLSS
jgi:hypothetical protein